MYLFLFSFLMVTILTNQALFQDRGVIRSMNVSSEQRIVAMMIQNQGQKTLLMYNSIKSKPFYKIENLNTKRECTRDFPFNSIKPVAWPHKKDPILVLNEKQIIMLDVECKEAQVISSFQAKILQTEFHYMTNSKEKWILMVLVQNGRVYEISGEFQNSETIKQKEIYVFRDKKILKIQYSPKDDILSVEYEPLVQKQNYYILEIQVKSAKVVKQQKKQFSIGAFDNSQEKLQLMKYQTGFDLMGNDGQTENIDVDWFYQDTAMGFCGSNTYLVVLRSSIIISNKYQLIFFNATDGSIKDKLKLYFQPKLSPPWYFGQNEFMMLDQKNNMRVFELQNQHNKSIDPLFFEKVKIIAILLIVFGIAYIFTLVNNKCVGQAQQQYQQQPIPQATNDIIQNVEN